MKRLLPLLLLLTVSSVFSQSVSIRVAQTSFSSVDPDGAGPATGSVTIQFELMAAPGVISADGMGLSFVYQSSKLMPTPTNTTVPEGPIASATGWNQMVDNRAGTDVTLSYAEQAFDKRMIITFNQVSGLDNANIPTTFTGVAQVTYWTLGTAAGAEGGYITPEDGGTVPQNALSSDGGLTSYNFLSPNLNAPLLLGSGIVPVLFTKVEAGCNTNGTIVKWSTASEFNSSYFELQRSTDGNSWSRVSSTKGAGNSSSLHAYQLYDQVNGAAFYRIKEVDIDGQFTYTSIVKSNCKFSGLGVIIYPVPARNILNLDIASDRNVKTHLMIVDGVGKTVRSVDVNLSQGNNTLQLNLNGLAGGEYILRSVIPGAELNKTFNIVK